MSLKQFKLIENVLFNLDIWADKCITDTEVLDLPAYEPGVREYRPSCT